MFSYMYIYIHVYGTFYLKKRGGSRTRLVNVEKELKRYVYGIYFLIKLNFFVGKLKKWQIRITNRFCIEIYFSWMMELHLQNIAKEMTKTKVGYDFRVFEHQCTSVSVCFVYYILSSHLSVFMYENRVNE